ncbi:MAG: hypothetical protein WCD76_21015 [Pyrinomonadaceae bacterium]
MRDHDLRPAAAELDPRANADGHGLRDQLAVHEGALVGVQIEQVTDAVDDAELGVEARDSRPVGLLE